MKHLTHRFRRIFLVLLTLPLLLTLWGAPQAAAFSGTTVQLLLYINQTTAFLNGEPHPLDVPAQVIGGRMYVPLKFLGDAMGFHVSWDAETQAIRIQTEKYNVLIDQKQGRVWMNGSPQPLKNVGVIKDGRLLVQVVWFASLTDAHTTYNSELKRVEVTYVRQPAGLKENEPVAKFALDKPIYRIGEPIQYIDLSYHPSGIGIVERKWEGRQPAFFKPGRYPVSLKVVDRNGNESKVFTREVVVGEEVLFNELDFQLYNNPIGSFVRDTTNTFRTGVNIPLLPKNTRLDTSRKLLVSNSPETFRSTGLLYQDTVNGKARLYATHINGMDRPARFMILATNHGSQTATVTTTNKGEVAPSPYAHLIGHAATIDYLVREPIRETMQIAPGETKVYVTMADFRPSQGVNVFYDIETNREVEFSFVAVEPGERIVRPDFLPRLNYDRHVRGTFDAADVHWSINGASITRPSRIIIGDSDYDKFIEGYDPLRREAVNNYGNYGVVYTVDIQKPKKMAILLQPRGGAFSGPFKINGQFVKAPNSGVITPFDGAYLLGRTTGTEEKLTIEFSPPSGSAFPVDLIFYPLDERG